MEQPSLNDHNKQEYPPMHTTEHVINRTMVNLFRMRTGNIRPYRTQKKQAGFCAANLSGRSGYYKNRKHRKRSIAKKFARYNGIYLSRGSYRAL